MILSEVFKTQKRRRAFDNGDIIYDELKKGWTRQLLTRIKLKLGISRDTDGEFRRATWYLDFMWYLTV